jgi:hypothetical protein
MIPIDFISNTQNPIKGTNSYEADTLGEYGIITAKNWCSDSSIVQEMFEAKEEGVS